MSDVTSDAPPTTAEIAATYDALPVEGQTQAAAVIQRIANAPAEEPLPSGKELAAIINALPDREKKRITQDAQRAQERETRRAEQDARRAERGAQSRSNT